MSLRTSNSLRCVAIGGILVVLTCGGCSGARMLGADALVAIVAAASEAIGGRVGAIINPEAAADADAMEDAV